MKKMKYFKFQKEKNNRWFIVLPDWEGDKSDLEMVMGADSMLEIFAQGEDEAHISMSTEPFEGAHELNYLKPEYAGGWYNYKSDLHEFDVWLCYVTKFVFGCFPQKIYLK